MAKFSSTSSGIFILSEEMRNCIISKQNEEAKRILPNENLDAYIDRFGLPLLHLVASYANPEITQYLIDKGCNIDAVYDDIFTPIIAAILSGSIQTIEILIDAHCKQDIKGKYLNNIIQFCTCDSLDNPFRAARQLILEMCLRRIKSHFGANEEDMFEALFQANCELHTLVRCMKDAKATKYFLDKGCDVDQCDPTTNLTPLQIATQLGLFENVKILLEYDANTYFNSTEFLSDFVLSLKSYENDSQDRLAIFELLLQYNVNFHDQIFSIFNDVNDLNEGGRIVTKLTLAQLVLDEACGRKISNAAHSWISDKIKSSEIMRMFYTLCEEQLNRMKETNFYESITLFDVLAESKEKLMIYVKKDNFISNFENAINNTLDADFYYYKALKNRISAALTMGQFEVDLLSENSLDLERKDI